MGNLIKVLIAPREAFSNLKEDASVGLPLILLVAGAAVVAVATLSFLDMNAVLAEQIETIEAEMTANGASEQEVENMVQMIEANADNPAVTGPIGTVIAAVIAAFAMLVVIVVHTIYLFIVSKICKDGLSFGDWFAFANWGRIPLVAGMVVYVVIAAAMGSSVTNPNELNLLSLTYYLGGPSGWTESLAASLDLPLIWSLIVMSIGYSVWTEKSMGVSTSVICLPFALVYLGIFLI